MTIAIYNPVGEIAPLPETAAVRAQRLHGARLGIVFNHHPACVTLWGLLEEALAGELVPSTAHRVTKSNISMPQPHAQLAELASRVDVAIVGVGA